MLSLRQPVFKGGACNYVMAAGGRPCTRPFQSSELAAPNRTPANSPLFSFLKKNRVNADAISRQQTLSQGRSVKSAFETAQLKASSEIVLCRRDQIERSRDAP